MGLRLIIPFLIHIEHCGVKKIFAVIGFHLEKFFVVGDLAGLIVHFFQDGDEAYKRFFAVRVLLNHRFVSGPGLGVISLLLIEVGKKGPGFHIIWILMQVFFKFSYSIIGFAVSQQRNRQIILDIGVHYACLF